MKDKTTLTLVNKDSSPAYTVGEQQFSLDKIKSPAILLTAEGMVIKSNKEIQTWIKKSPKETKGKSILEIFPELNHFIIEEISFLYPGKSLVKELKSSKLSFFHTYYNNQVAILLLATVKDSGLNGDFFQELNAQIKKEGVLHSDGLKLKGLSESWKNSSKEFNVQLLLGELAQLSVQEKNEVSFIRNAVEFISKRMHQDLVYIEKIAPSMGEISELGAEWWSGAKYRIEELKSLSDWVNPVVVDSKTQLYLLDDEIFEVLKEGSIDSNSSKPSSLLALPLLHQGECLGVVGFISFSESGKKPEFEYNGLLIADLLSVILSDYRDKSFENQQLNRFQKIADFNGSACWSVSSDGVVGYFNQSFIDAVVKKGAGFGTKVSYPKNKEGKTAQGFSDWEEEYNKAFSGELIEFEIQSIDSVGNVFWWEIRLIPIESENLGYAEVLGIANDVTKFKKRENEAQGSHQQYVELIDAFDDIYFQADKFGNLTSVSSGIFKVTGIKTEEVIGTNIKTYLPAPDQFHKQLVSLRDGSLVTGLELCLMGKEGKEIWLNANLKPIHSSWNEWMGFEGIARDNSAMRFAQWSETKSKLEANDALKVKERFLANISHEIRTPLNGIMGMAQLLYDTQLKEGQKEYVEIIQRSGDALLHILNHLLDLSDAETGKIILKSTEVYLPDLVKGISRLYMDQARLKNIEFSYEMPSELENVLIDETRFYQLLNNLVSNAFKFTIQGSIKIKVSIDKSVSKEFLSVEVSDTGCGLSFTEQTSLKQMIASENPEYAFQATKGGVGLLTSKLIAKAMSGQFGFVSSPGAGSTFWLKLPFIPVVPLANQSPIAMQKTSYFEGFVPEVLLVDDNAINLKVAYEILMKYGCQVGVATNGEEAVDKIKSTFYHVVLMDIQMPVMDGVTATNIIKGLDLDWCPPIIAMTAYCLKEDKMRFVEAGMDDFIAKPISADKILSKVKYWTEKSFGASRRNLEITDDLVPEVKHLTIRGELESIFDFEALKGLYKHLGEDILLDSIHEFAMETSKLLEEMDTALLMKDYETLKSHSHTLKGNAGTFGVNQLSAIAKEIEFDLKNNKLATLSSQIEKLRDSANQFLKSYNLLNKSHEWKN